MVGCRQQLKFEGKNWTRGDRATCVLDEVSVVDRSTIDHWVAPVVESHALGDKLRAQTVGGALDRVDLQAMPHHDRPDVRAPWSHSPTGSARSGVGRTAPCEQ